MRHRTGGESVKRIIQWLLLSLVLAAGIFRVHAQQADPLSLRGATPIDAVNAAPLMRKHYSGEPLPRAYVQQPPLIPHRIRGYHIDRRSNKCLTCHSWTRYRETGATKISPSHFRDREGRELSHVAPRRYFCTQCHVPQAMVDPPVANTFRPVPALGGD